MPNSTSESKPRIIRAGRDPGKTHFASLPEAWAKAWFDQNMQSRSRVERRERIIHEPHISEKKWVVSNRKNTATLFRDHGQPTHRVFQLTQYKGNQVAPKGSWKLHVRLMQYKGRLVAGGRPVPTLTLYKVVLPPSDLKTAVKSATALLNTMIGLGELPWIPKE